MRSRRAVAAATAALLALVPASPALAQEVVSVDTYRARLAAAIERCDEAARAPSPQAMDGVRSALGLPAVVRLSTGRVVVVPMPGFLDALDGTSAADFTRALAHLRALDRVAGEAAGAATLSDAEVASLLERAYRGLGARRPGLVDRIRRMINDAVGWVIDRLVNARGLGSVVVWAFVVGLIAGSIWLLRRGTVPDRRETDARDREEAEVDWERLAEEARRRGDLETAIRASFRALLRELAAEGVIADEPSVTAGEARLATATRTPRVHGSVARATLAFERVTYGNDPPVEGDVDALRDALREVRAA